jgi:hypothetical protein
MGQDRLNGLAVLNIHKNIPINIEEVINIFSRSSRRIKMEEFNLLCLLKFVIIKIISFNKPI